MVHISTPKFEVDQRVRIVRVPGDVLENRTGTILGTAAHSYIVLLDKPTTVKGVCMTPYCLEKI